MRLLPVVVGVGIAAVVGASPALSGSCSPTPAPGDPGFGLVEGSCQVTCEPFSTFAYVQVAGVQAFITLASATHVVASCFTNAGDCSNFNFIPFGIGGQTLTCSASGLVFLPEIETPALILGTRCVC